MKTYILFMSTFSLITFLHYNPISAQSSTQPPSPSGPTNITKILEKAGQFTSFIRLLKTTHIADQINTQLNNSNQGLTIFAPPDNAFSNLKSGTLNSLTDQQKVELIQFHIIPSFFSVSSFQTVSNPLPTQAGNANNGDFPLNVTTSGNQVNITTGVVDTVISNTIYTDSSLAVYQVDKVLLPLDIFGTSSPSPAPKPEKGSAPTSAEKSTDSSPTKDDSSRAMGLYGNLFVPLSVVVVMIGSAIS